jgi:hypothetical protein
MNKTEEWIKIRSIMILNGCSPLYIELARDEFFKEDEKDNAQAHQTPERSVGGMVPPIVGNSGLENRQ